MAKNRLEIPDLEIKSPEPVENKAKKAPKSKKAPAGKKKFSIARVFREMISELKKVDWAPFKRTKNNSGVLAQTSTVMIVVLFFLIIISAFDTGLAELLKLLLESASPN
jgi:preprotein translocase subunit SecE